MKERFSAESDCLFCRSIGNGMRYTKNLFLKLQYAIDETKRLNNHSNRYHGLELLKNKYAGKRCFIICTGPSLTREDILKLENEYTFGMNSISKLFGEIDWRPTFYGIQDLEVFDKMKDSLPSENDHTICLAGDSITKVRQVPDSWIWFPLNSVYHDYAKTVQHKYYAKFSDDCYKTVYNGFSITYSLLQIAVYMGFSTIYIIGADNSYSKNGQHHFIETGHVSKFAYSYTERFDAGYAAAKEYADSHNIKIFNATRGGFLEIFPRVNLDDIIKENK